MTIGLQVSLSKGTGWACAGLDAKERGVMREWALSDYVILLLVAGAVLNATLGTGVAGILLVVALFIWAFR